MVVTNVTSETRIERQCVHVKTMSSINPAAPAQVGQATVAVWRPSLFGETALAERLNEAGRGCAWTVAWVKRTGSPRRRRLGEACGEKAWDGRLIETGSRARRWPCAAAPVMEG